MNFQIIALTNNTEELMELEQYWLNILFLNYKDDILNILTNADNSTYGIKMSDESKFKMSLAKKGKSLSESHRLAISEGKKGSLHHLYGKKRDISVTEKQSKSMQNYY